MSLLEVMGLTHSFGENYLFKNADFTLNKGEHIGIVGQNGAGKSTTINAILGLINRDSGNIELLGEADPQSNDSIRNQIGVVFDGNNYPDVLSARKLNRVLGNIYSAWDERKFFSLLEKMSLPTDKKIKEFSKGMKMKLSIAAALSHNSKLLILDEATSGLDPVVRDDILDMFLEFVQDENNSVMVSSHITSDLEKVADYIVFIHKGKVVFCKSKDELRYKYGIIRCGAAQFDAVDKDEVIAYRKQDYEWEILIADREKAQRKYPKAVIDPATIDEIMLLYVKGETK